MKTGGPILILAMSFPFSYLFFKISPTSADAARLAEPKPPGIIIASCDDDATVTSIPSVRLNLSTGATKGQFQCRKKCVKILLSSNLQSSRTLTEEKNVKRAANIKSAIGCYTELGLFIETLKWFKN